MCSREQVQILSNSEGKKQIVSLLKRVTMVLIQSKNNFRWLFTVILKQNSRQRFIFSYDIQHNCTGTVQIKRDKSLFESDT